MRGEGVGGPQGLRSSSLAGNSISDTDDVEILDIDDLTPTLDESHVSLHAKRTTPKDKTIRHVRHDDCCGYCERFCKDKITHTKRREIEAWRQDVSVTMAANEAEHVKKIKKKPRLKFLKYTPLGAPEEENGFRRIKTPKDIKNTLNRPYLSRNSKRRQKSWPMQGTYTDTRNIDVGDFSNLSSRLADISVKAEHNLPINDNSMREDDPDRMGVQTPAFSRDSLDSDTEITDPELKSEPMSSQHSYRSCSNELLNVLTIDDAIRNHRHKILTNRHIRVIDSRNRPRLPTSKRPKFEIRESAAARNRLRSQGEPLSAKTKTQSRNSGDAEFRLHPDSAKPPRPYSKFTETSLDQSTEIGLSRLGTSNTHDHKTKQYDGTPVTPNGGKPRDGTIQAVYKAVDHVVGNRAVNDDLIHKGLFNHEKMYNRVLVAKPASKRFQRMNNNLHKLMIRDYLPDHKMAERLQKHNVHPQDYFSEPSSKMYEYTSIGGSYDEEDLYTPQFRAGNTYDTSENNIYSAEMDSNQTDSLDNTGEKKIVHDISDSDPSVLAE